MNLSKSFRHLLSKKHLSIKRIQTQIFFSFHVNNYFTPLKSDGMTRFHNRFRYDENAYIEKDEDVQEQIIEEEKKKFEKIEKEFQKYTDFYFKRSYMRKDIRTRELPEKYENYEYFSKFTNIENNDYEILYRKHLQTGKEEKVLDLKEIPFVTRRFWKTVKMAKISLSDDHRYLAFIIDLKNNEHFTLGIRDLKLEKFLNIRIDNCSNIVFGADNNFLFYVKYDEKMRSNQVFVRGFEKEHEEELVYEEKNEQFWVDISKSKDKKILFINAFSKQISEIYALKRDNKKFNPKNLIKLISRDKKARAFALHADNFYLLTDMDKVFDYKVMILEKEKFDKGNIKFEDYYLPKSGEKLKEIDIFKKNMVLYMEKDGLSFITVIDLLTKSSYNIDIKEELALISPGLNENYDTESFRFHVDTPLLYNQIYEYNFSTKNLKVLEEFVMEGPAFNRKNIVSQRVYALSKDGEEVPLTLIHKKSLKKDRKNKLLLHGYGAYGLPLDIGFSVVYLAALENDWILAFAHVRGGNEKGWKWHKSATKEKKLNSFYDFISCAEFLIAEGYTHPSLLCAHGSSAGGLLIGAVINMRPNLFKAVVMVAPYLDILSCLCNKELPLTISDYEEFGNPVESSKVYDLIRSYSPYENILNQEYPFVYIAMGSEDFRIPKWSVLKYLKRFQEKAQNPKLIEEICPKNILLNTLGGGHHGEASNTERIKEKSTYMGLLDYVLLHKSNDVKIQ